MRTAVFDLDGTLADTSGDLLAAANAALSGGGFGIPLHSGDARTAFRGARAMLDLGLTRHGLGADRADKVEDLYPILLEHYRIGLCRETRLYEGATTTLDRLEADGWLLAICTNKPIALARNLLDQLGVAGRFRAILGADSLAVRKPDPGHVWETIALAGGRRDLAVMIGDTETDRSAARNAGIPCVLVGFGPDGAGVADLEPEAVLGHYDDLPDLLAELLPRQHLAG